MTPAHWQVTSRRYLVHYPEHPPRAADPHRRDFEEWKRRRRNAETWWCDFAKEHRDGKAGECDLGSPLEAHHRVVELAMLNEIDIALLEKDYPGISADDIGAWIDGDANLTLLCVNHHRGPMGVHCASYSDFSSESYVRDLIAKAGKS